MFTLPSFTHVEDARTVLLSRLGGVNVAIEHMQEKLSVMAAYTGAKTGVAAKLADVIAELETAQATLIEAIALQATG